MGKSALYGNFSGWMIAVKYFDSTTLSEREASRITEKVEMKYIGTSVVSQPDLMFLYIHWTIRENIELS